MKSGLISIFVGLFCFYSSSATDLVVSEGGGGGSYGTITDALNAAAASGDRIIIVPKPGGATYNEALVITKSIQLLSGTEGVYWRMVGNITYNPAATGSQLTIVCMENLAGNITTGIAAPGASRSVVRILGCKLNLGNISFTPDNYELTCESDSIMSGSISLNYGKVVGNYISAYNTSLVAVTIGNGDVTPSNDYVYVVGNKIICSTASYYYNGIACSTSQHYFYISNNFIQTNSSYQYAVYASSSKTGIQNNQVLNNSVSSTTINYYWAFDFYYMNSPTIVHNNVFGPNLYYGINSNTTLYTAISFNHFHSSIAAILGGSAVSDGTNVQSTFSIDPDLGLVNSGSPVDGGNPDLAHYDLDLTPNNAGSGGGSYSITQFLPMGSPTGSRTTFVIAPRRVLTGQTINVNAEGFDK
jgi:hypothetical protein